VIRRVAFGARDGLRQAARTGSGHLRAAAAGSFAASFCGSVSPRSRRQPLSALPCSLLEDLRKVHGRSDVGVIPDIDLPPKKGAAARTV
jgi:hypothetical protein